MKVSLNWLKQYVDVPLKSDEFFHRLTMAGLEVENVTKVSGDTVFELEITPNRPDCLNVLGVARETSAILEKSIRAPKVSASPKTKGKVDITIQDKDACVRYIGTLIEGVTVKSSPKDLSQPISNIGVTIHNNLVDITNYCLFEFGQPLHVFDYDKLIGGKIIVRWAKKGEKIITLDDEERELDSSILVIADAKRPVAIAGIMGGKETAVDANTKNVLLESAFFDLGVIRQASRKLGLSSDSCYRFERGVDFETVLTGSSRAKDLILKLAGGKVVSHNDCIARKVNRLHKTIKVSQTDIEQLIGSSISINKSKGILKRLGFSVDVSGHVLSVKSPPNRGDIAIKQDVIEEIVRIVGFDNLDVTLPNIVVDNIDVDTSALDTKSFLNEQMRGQGFHEIVPYSMTNKEDLAKCKLDGLKTVDIQNPMSMDQECMRPSSLPSFLTVYAFNLNRGARNARLFELGRVYQPKLEKDVLSALIAGDIEHDWRILKKNAASFYDLKGAIENVFVLRNVEIRFESADVNGLASGQTANIFVGKKNVGHIGLVSPDVLSAWSIKEPNVYFAQVDCDCLRSSFQQTPRFLDISNFPAMTRDVSLAAPLAVTYQQVSDICWREGKKLLTAVDFIEEYKGDKISSDQRGLVFSLRYQSSKRTLTEDEVNSLHETICQALIKELHVTRR